MTKFLIDLEIKTTQKVTYEVEAESREKLDQYLSEWSVSDLGDCVAEYEPEWYDEQITEIKEKIEK